MQVSQSPPVSETEPKHVDISRDLYSDVEDVGEEYRPYHCSRPRRILSVNTKTKRFSRLVSQGGGELEVEPDAFLLQISEVFLQIFRKGTEEGKGTDL